MTSLVEIKSAIASLSDDETSVLFSWLQERVDNNWDNQIRIDAQEGKLNRAIQRVQVHISANRVNKLDKVNK